MAFGSTAKKLQSVVDMADDLYSKLNDLRDQMSEIRETIDTTNERVEAVEADLEEQRALLEAIAAANDIDLPLEDDENGTAEDTERTSEA